MMKLSENLNRFSLSPIVEISELAGRLRAEGRVIYDLSSGEPDFITEDFICDAGHAAIDAGETKYTFTDGTTEFKQAIIRKFQREGHPDYSVKQVAVGSGAKPLIANILMTLLDAGDEVVIPGPCWSSHPGMVLALGGSPVVVNCAIDEGFKMSADRLRSALNDKTRVLILCNPNNPTGAVYSAAEQRELADVLHDFPDLWILSDEIYSDIVFDGNTHQSFVVAAPELLNRTITVNGLSKGYAMTGWRIGYAVGPESMMDGLRQMMSQVAGSPSTLAQIAGIEALDGSQVGLVTRRKAYQARRDAVMQWFSDVKQFRIPKPAGAFYVYVDCAGAIGQTTPQGEHINSSADLARYLLEYGGVAIVPGEAFESSTSFRLSIASSMEQLSPACKAIVEACRDLS
ncbi:MAG: aspartate aminotransferase [Parasphingorhabdus sp.]|jgi:aspartate aminotransferase